MLEVGVEEWHVAIAAAFLLDSQIAFLDQVVNDPLHPALSDVHALRDVSHPKLRFTAEQDQDMGVIGEQGPILHVRLRVRYGLILEA